jgi:acyl-CoA thioesterase-1
MKRFPITWLLVALLFMTPMVCAQPTGGVLVLGDSLSAAHNLRLEDGWVALLRQRLAPTIPVHNASISGETTAGGVRRLPGLLQRHAPELVVIELGANDGLRGQSLSAMREHLEAMIRMSREAGAQVALLGIELPVNYGPAYRGQFRQIFQSLAETYQLPYLPFLLDGVALRQELMQDDGLHPTTEAQPLVLENAWPVICEALTNVRSQACS